MLERRNRVDFGAPRSIDSVIKLGADDTRRSLLLRLKDTRDDEAGNDFTAVCEPLIHAIDRLRKASALSQLIGDDGLAISAGLLLVTQRQCIG